MSVTLIVPAARDGPGFDGKPTWLLQHPRGNIVLENVLQCLGLERVGRIIICVKQDHIDRFCGGDPLAIQDLVRSHLAESQPAFKGSFEVHILQRETSSAPDTVVEAITARSVHGPIFIKDCDGSFPHTIEPGSYVVGMRLTTQSDVENLPSKSFLECNGTILTNIQEKQVISDIIGVGGYAFESSDEFVEAFRSITKVQLLASHALNAGASGGSSSAADPAAVVRVFVSHLVYHMMLEKRKVFGVSFTTSLDDWKTEAAWRKYVSKHSNILIALEGVLFANQSSNVVLALTDERRALTPVQRNIDYLQRIVKNGQRSKILVMTRRPESRRDETVELLRAHGIPFDEIIFGMLGSMSCVIGAYGNEIQHPSVVGYSVPYGSEQLGSVLHLN